MASALPRGVFLGPRDGLAAPIDARFGFSIPVIVLGADSFFAAGFCAFILAMPFVFALPTVLNEVGLLISFFVAVYSGA